jgi:molybdopterin synthase catalytic subunit
MRSLIGDAMVVKLKMFAVLRERSGVSEMDLELGEGATVAMAVAEVGKRYASAGEILKRCASAVNQEYAKPDSPLRDGDELALIPPVSGG